MSKHQNRAIEDFIKASARVLLAYFVVSSLKHGDDISISIFDVSISAPAAYFLSATSFVFLMTTLAFNHLSTAMYLKIQQVNRVLLSGFSGNIFGMIRGYDNNSLGIPGVSNPFFKEVFPLTQVMGFLFLLLVLSFLVPVGAVGIYFAGLQYDLLLSNGLPFVEKVAAALGFATITFSLLYVAFFHSPMPYRKNKFSIRWFVLQQLSLYWPHPQRHAWSADSKNRRHNNDEKSSK
ncbi:hypothetical protein KUV39_09280 [Phaeobacter italicus]|uniref:hypothetical protein n=1 Tax=Phaeobacter italicus TaxID=481446 RepID=UPI001C94328D|nr:hypothetical protein [Phaeobacter italicus]MBY5976836.1 hypothetical protein [Phaeobacter italicus]